MSKRFVPFTNKKNLLLLPLVISLSSCTFLDILFNSPEFGTYIRSDGTEYTVSMGSTYFTLKGSNDLCVMFNHLKTDPDENHMMNLGGVSCSETSRKQGKWKGTFSLRENDRIQIMPSNEEPFEIVYINSVK